MKKLTYAPIAALLIGCSTGSTHLVPQPHRELDAGPALCSAVEPLLPALVMSSRDTPGAPDLQGVDLTCADLHGTYLKCPYLVGANLMGSDLVDAYVLDGNLIGADLRGVALKGTHLDGTTATSLKSCPDSLPSGEWKCTRQLDGSYSLLGPEILTPAGLVLGASSHMSSIALDDANVYFVATTADATGTSYTSSIMKVRMDGSAPPTLLTSVPNFVGQLDVHDRNLYFSTTGQNQDGIFKVALDGGTPIQLAPAPAGFFAVDSRNLYWLESGNPTQLKRVSLGGGTPDVLATDSFINRLAVDASNVYYVGDGALKKLPIDAVPTTLVAGEGGLVPQNSGTTPITLALGISNGVGGIAVDATSVYWTDTGNNTVNKVDRDGGTPVTLAKGGGADLLALDAGSVYFTNRFDDEHPLMRVPLEGGIPTDLPHRCSMHEPNALAVGAGGVFFTVDTIVMRVPLM